MSRASSTTSTPTRASSTTSTPIRTPFSPRSTVNSKAHEGKVTSLLFTHDSRSLISHGSDKKIRLWNLDRGTNELVNFSGIQHHTAKSSNSLSLSSNGALLYCPSHENIDVYEVRSGNHITTLRAHFDNVNSTVFAPSGLELFSGASDSQITLWEPSRVEDVVEENVANEAREEDEEDRWSISEEEGW
eukprot:TRINITY_DN818_c0_g1_i3.p1 TRINITY_DN818_c0_g1~~TRINITY_DN818_c0_g1_i3.p1  ORF type:complete len:188 (-),score=45.32 TRINITY_DN818_c0_g1_i3:688-1251(-)